MNSDACITDFDSDDDDDDDVVCTRGRINDGDVDHDEDDRYSRCDSSVSTVILQPWTRHVREFGDFVDNHGWIQYLSKSLPGRPYFHNTYSGCSTWYRPVSRYVNIPFVSAGRERANPTDDPAASDLELMSVSDNEKESKGASACERDRSLMPDVIARYYYASRANYAFDDSNESAYRDRKRRDNTNSENNNNTDADDDEEEEEAGRSSDGCCNSSKSGPSPFRVTSFLETEFFVDEGRLDHTGTIRGTFETNDNTSVSSSSSSSSVVVPQRRVVYRVPRLKKIGLEDQLEGKRRHARADPKALQRGPRRIVCDMYGVRTVNYDLPGPEQARTKMVVKTSRLSESESDSEPDPVALIKRSCELDWGDIEGLRQPLLSDSSTSPSSRSDSSSGSSSSSSRSTTNSSSSSSSTGSSASTCSTCTSCQ